MLKCVIMCEKKQVLSIGKQPFLPQNMLSLAHIGLAGSFGALLVGVWGAQADRASTYFIFIRKSCKSAIQELFCRERKREDNGRTWVGNKSQNFEVKMRQVLQELPFGSK